MATEFGSCCADLKDVISGQEFEPLISVADNGVLYMSVGLIEGDEKGGEEGGMVDHPVFFCPFCGTKVQTEDEVRAKGGFDDEDEATA